MPDKIVQLIKTAFSPFVSCSTKTMNRVLTSKACQKLTCSKPCPRVILVILRFNPLQEILPCTKLLRWDISFGFGMLLTLVFGIAPDGLQFPCLQRQQTFCCFCIKMPSCLVSRTVTLDKLAGLVNSAPLWHEQFNR